MNKLLRQLLAQYLWFLVITIIALIYLNPHYKKIKNKGLYSSQYYPSWNGSAKPSWFLIVSDLHLGTVRPNSYQKVFSTLNFGIQTYHPQKIIIPGDLTDNYDGQRLYPYKNQMVQDWELYKTLLKNLNISREKIIHVRGNHDVFKIAGINSKNHFGKDLFNYTNEDEFHFQTFFYNTESATMKFVLIHPYRFPIGPICYTAVDAFPTTKYYQKLTDILQKNDSDITFLVTHYPAIAFSPARSIEKVYSKSPNQRVVISGHWHKRMNTKVMHHGPTLELIISGMVKSYHIINIMTIDNKRVVNHQIDINEAENYLITNPVPYEMNIGNGFFNAVDSELRVLAFLNEKENLPDLKFSIVSKFDKKIVIDQNSLNCEREIEKNVRLCSAPLGLKEGNYSLIKSGDWKGEMDFIIGNYIPPFYDNPPDCLPIWEWYYLFVSVAFFFAIAIFPYPKDIKKMLSDEQIPLMFDSKPNKKESVFCGFLTLHRILYHQASQFEVPKYLTFSILFSFFYILFLPLSFFEIEGNIGMLFSWGYICKQKVLWHFLGGEIGLRSIYFIIAPVLFLASFYSISAFSFWSTLVAVLYVLFNLRWFVSLIYKLIDMSGVFFALTSPVIYLPILLYYSLFKWIILTHNRRRSNSNENLDIL